MIVVTTRVVVTWKLRLVSKYSLASKELAMINIPMIPYVPYIPEKILTIARRPIKGEDILLVKNINIAKLNNKKR